MPGPLELWLLSPKVPSFDQDSPWFDTGGEEEDEPLPLLRPKPQRAQFPGIPPPASQPSEDEPPSTRRSPSDAVCASSLAPAASSIPPSSVRAADREAPRWLVMTGFVAIAAVIAVWLSRDDDPSRHVPLVAGERVPTAAVHDPTTAQVGAAEELEPGSARPQSGNLRGPFNRVAAATSLSAAVGQAASCSVRQPRTDARARVTFAPSGQVSAVRFDAPSAEQAPQSACVAAALRASGVPPFDGGPVTVAVRVPLWMPLQNEPPPPGTASADIYPDDWLSDDLDPSAVGTPDRHRANVR